MKVFLSWSGASSKQVAQVLRDWLPRVIQSVEPWMSAEDIDKGSRWLLELGKTLEDGAYGIVCVTPDNIQSPWLAFEAGALAKELDDSRVSPFLLGIGHSDVTGPLSQFQGTLHNDREDVTRLLRGINARLTAPLKDDVLDDAIAQRWGDLQQRLSEVAGAEPAPPTRSDRQVLDEVLELVRGLDRRAGRMSRRPVIDSGLIHGPKGMAYDLGFTATGEAVVRLPDGQALVLPADISKAEMNRRIKEALIPSLSIESVSEPDDVRDDADDHPDD